MVLRYVQFAICKPNKTKQNNKNQWIRPATVTQTAFLLSSSSNREEPSLLCISWTVAIKRDNLKRIGLHVTSYTAVAVIKKWKCLMPWQWKHVQAKTHMLTQFVKSSAVEVAATSSPVRCKFRHTALTQHLHTQHIPSHMCNVSAVCLHSLKFQILPWLYPQVIKFDQATPMILNISRHAHSYCASFVCINANACLFVYMFVCTYLYVCINK